MEQTFWPKNGHTSVGVSDRSAISDPCLRRGRHTQKSKLTHYRSGKDEQLVIFRPHLGS
jgi:hypothetical protein